MITDTLSFVFSSSTFLLYPGSLFILDGAGGDVT